LSARSGDDRALRPRRRDDGRSGHARDALCVGSLGKSMVATAPARLAAEGRLGLEDPVAAHVPELRRVEWAQRASVRDLMANRSQLPLRESLEFTDFEGDDEDVLSRFAAEVAKAETTARPWSYTNAGWCVLGRAIESVTGLTWEDAMHANVLLPLAMDQTTFATWPTSEPRATGHRVTTDGPEPVERWTPRALGPAGSTPLSTLGDVLRLARAHLENPMLEVLRTAHAEVRIQSWLDAWCLGLARFDWEGGPVWGWDGLISGDRAILRLLPDQHGAVVLLTNGSSGRALYRSLRQELVVRDVLNLGPDHAPRYLELRLCGQRRQGERRHAAVVLAGEEGVDRRQRHVLVRSHVSGDAALEGVPVSAPMRSIAGAADALPRAVARGR
jgi:CubicO group peptidase (beta-lactamase class C family)